MFIINHYMKNIYHSLLNCTFTICCITACLSFQDHIYGNHTSQTHVWVMLINSYSWYISRNSWQNNIISSWWLLWTNSTNPSIVVSASTGSNFTISGDIVPTTWWWSGNYNIITDVILNNWDTTKSLQALFLKDNEPYYSNILYIILDTIAPSPSHIIWPNNNDILSWIINLSWTASIDQGIWLSHYNVHFSLDPWFLWEVIIPISWDSLQISSSYLPTWTLFRYVESVDILWNSSSSNPYFFHNWTYSVIQNNGWTLWAWWWYAQDSIPYTGSYILSWIYTSTYSWQTIVDWDNVFQENLPKDISLKENLIGNFYSSKNKYKRIISLPSIDDSTVHNSASLPIHKQNIYTTLLWVYYHNFKPIWYNINYISRLIIPLYYLRRWLWHYAFRGHINNIHKKVRKYLTQIKIWL